MLVGRDSTVMDIVAIIWGGPCNGLRVVLPGPAPVAIELPRLPTTDMVVEKDPLIAGNLGIYRYDRSAKPWWRDSEGRMQWVYSWDSANGS